MTDQAPNSTRNPWIGLRGLADLWALRGWRSDIAQDHQLYPQKNKKNVKKKHTRKSRRATSLKVGCFLSNFYFLQQCCFQMPNVGQSVALVGKCNGSSKSTKTTGKRKHLEISRIWILQVWCHRTWQAGNPPHRWDLSGKIMELEGVFQQTMFDQRGAAWWSTVFCREIIHKWGGWRGALDSRSL